VEVWKPPVFAFLHNRKAKATEKRNKKKEPSDDRRFRRRKCMGFYGAMDNGNHLFTFPFFSLLPVFDQRLGKGRRAGAFNLNSHRAPEIGREIN